MITLGAKSLAKMTGVHPDLVRVFHRAAAIAGPVDDFTIIQGVRTKDEMWENWGKGRTLAECRAKGVPDKYAQPKLGKVTWLNNPLMSNHRVMADGFGCAIDAAPYPIDWNDTARFRRMHALIQRAADIEKVKIRFIDGDWPHTELAS